MSRLPLSSAVLTALLSFASLCSTACDSSDDALPGSPGGKADDPTDAPFGLDSRPINTTCRAPERPASGSSVRLQRAFSNLSFSRPVAMMQAPDSDRWYVLEKRGVIWSFDDSDSVSSRQLVLDFRSQVEATPNEAGLLGMAFHPNFAVNGEVFLSYTMRSQGALFSVVVRMRSTDGGTTFDASTQELVLYVQQPYENHNGGTIAFGPDDLLYVGFGDGGYANDPHGNGQNRDTRLGSLLRIDVDSAEPFAVPPDNPFVGSPGLDEIYAWGIRNPWKFSFDMATGALWLADVGQDEWEEVDIIENGGNYGWNKKEGFECFSAAFPCDAGVIDPVVVYDHSQNDRSITGGYVYRGSSIPSLAGSYIYGDFVSGRMWGLFPDPVDGSLEPQLLLATGRNISSFAQDHDGEMYLLSYGDGSVHRIAPSAPVTSDFPQLLSETGCFDPTDPKRVASGVLPFNVNMPLWSDNAGKERYLAIPDGTRIHVEQDGDFTFPLGSVLIKTFWLDNRRIETRLLVRHDDGGWGGYAYEWNDAQTDATLLPAGKTVQVGAQSWQIPSRSDCAGCHTDAAGNSLGPEILQLNGKQVYASTNRNSNQIATLARIGMFDNLSANVDVAQLPAIPHMEDASASLESRAKAYLHSNCSHCHRPGGPGRSDADMRYQVSFAQSELCDQQPETSDLGIAGARLIRPGSPTQSLLALRMGLQNVFRMPPLGTDLVHTDGVTLIRDWIESMNGCP